MKKLASLFYASYEVDTNFALFSYLRCMNDTIKDTLSYTIKASHRKNLVCMIVYLIVQNTVSYIQSSLIQVLRTARL